MHISHMSRKFIKHPLEAVSVGDIVDVEVLEVEPEKQRIALTMLIGDEGENTPGAHGSEKPYNVNRGQGQGKSQGQNRPSKNHSGNQKNKQGNPNRGKGKSANNRNDNRNKNKNTITTSLGDLLNGLHF